MKTLIINSKISDILYSLDSFGNISAIVIRKENGELINYTLTKEIINMSFKSLISKRLYYLRVYHKSNGEIVNRLKVIQNQHINFFKSRISVLFDIFYFKLIFANNKIESLEYCFETKKIICKYGEGKYLRF